MATPVFKFKHPDIPGEDLYFIQNTYFEQPATIPMDLATFILYHLDTDRTLYGFFNCWRDLQITGSTLVGENFNDWFNNDEKLNLYDDAFHSGALRQAEINALGNNYIRDFIDNQKHETESIEDFITTNASSAIRHYRNSEYYSSRHQLFSYFWENENYDNKNVDFLNEEVLIQLYEKKSFVDLDGSLSNNIPLELIPHKYRRRGFFKNECIAQQNFMLLPDIYFDKSLILELFEKTKPNYIPIYLGDKFTNDRDLFLEAIKVNPASIFNASETLQNDKNLLLE